jgi:hypothetical protein
MDVPVRGLRAVPVEDQQQGLSQPQPATGPGREGRTEPVAGGAAEKAQRGVRRRVVRRLVIRRDDVGEVGAGAEVFMAVVEEQARREVRIVGRVRVAVDALDEDVDQGGVAGVGAMAEDPYVLQRPRVEPLRILRALVVAEGPQPQVAQLPRRVRRLSASAQRVAQRARGGAGQELVGADGRGDEQARDIGADAPDAVVVRVGQGERGGVGPAGPLRPAVDARAARRLAQRPAPPAAPAPPVSSAA